MDSTRFDRISRVVGEQKSRRGMLKTAAGTALALAGMSAVGHTLLGADVAADSNKGYSGDDCSNNPNICKKGLRCNDDNKCEYKHKCGSKRRGKAGNACKNNHDCCKKENLICDNKKCKRNN